MGDEVLYKVLDRDGSAFHGGMGKWNLPKGNKPGKWMEKISPVIPCRQGYHLCREQDLVKWIGPAIYVAEGRGEGIVHDNCKVVYGQARLVKATNFDLERIVKFAEGCAEHVSHLRGAAGAAARAAEAARAAARAAEAARAVGAAAWAAWAAEAARAAEVAAEVAEITFQTQLLLSLLED